MRTQKKILYGILVIIIAGLSLELLLRAIDFHYYPLDCGMHAGNSAQVFIQENGIVKTREDKVREKIFRPQTFKALPENGTLRVVALGGSNVNWMGKLDSARKGLDQILFEHRDETVFQKAEIINSGGGGYASSRLLMVLAGLLKWSPDILFIYMGHNELGERMMVEPMLSENSLSQLWWSSVPHSRLLQGYSKILSWLRKPVMLAVRDRIWDGLHENAPQVDEECVKGFRENLDRMVRLTLNNKVSVILSSVGINRSRSLMPGDAEEYRAYVQAWKAIDKGELKKGLNILNTRISRISHVMKINNHSRDIAEKYDLPFLDVDELMLNIAKPGIPDENLFADKVHLNDQAREALEEAFVELIRENYDIIVKR